MRKGRGTLGEYRCFHCGRHFRAESSQALRCCGTECERSHEARLAELRRQLEAAGFVREAAAPNRWTKGGVGVTEEQIHFDGLEKVLARHGRAVERRAGNAPSGARAPGRGA